jgi:hypothetical protein
MDGEVANGVEQDVLRPERCAALPPAGYHIPESPAQKALFDSCDEDADKSCRRQRKKSSVVNSESPPLRKSCWRHPWARRSRTRILSIALEHVGVSLNAPSFKDVTELGARRVQRLTLMGGECQLRSDGSAVDEGELNISFIRRGPERLSSLNDIPGSRRVNLLLASLIVP